MCGCPVSAGHSKPTARDPAQAQRAEGKSIAMNNLKRFTVCKLAGHKWAKVGYPPTADGETSSSTFLRCMRCGKENHDAGTVARGGGSVF